MAFKFKRKESLRKAVRRLGQKPIEKALEDLKHCGTIEAVHEVRKGIKALRALLRLTRAALSRGDYRRSTRKLREVAGYLGAARDARVKVNAVDKLACNYKRELAPHSFRDIKELLVADCREQQSALSHTRASAKAARVLKGLARRFDALAVKNSGWSGIAPGIKRTYRDGRRAYQLVSDTGRPEDFHQWRKRVKDLYYQVGLLCPVWPEQMHAAEAELKQLGEQLGDDHDLVLLTEACATQRARTQARTSAETLKALVVERQKELREHALALGARFYQEKPLLFCKRLERYWKQWHREPKQALPSGTSP